MTRYTALCEKITKASAGALMCALLVAGAAPTITKAQNLPDDFSLPGLLNEIKEQLSIDIYPEIPKPNEEVTITAESYSTDLNRATIIWSFNDKEALKGTGEKEFKFITGPVGSQNVVKLRIIPVSGPEISKTFRFTPAEVDILWEAKTYTPPFYKGKALFTPEADVTFVAVPNILEGNKNIQSNEAVYMWKNNRRAQADKSGFGRNAYKFTGSIIIKPEIIGVEAYSKNDKKNKASAEVKIEAEDPQALLYEHHPLYGTLFNKAITNTFFLSRTEAQIAAFPYFFSTKNKNALLTYNWDLNSLPITAPSTENLMTFRKTNSESGEVSVSVLINSITNILQEAQSGISLVFGTDSDNTFSR